MSQPENALQSAITTALAEAADHGLTPELRAAVLAAARRLPHIEQVAFSCGISPRTLIVWLRAGLRTREEPFASFALEFFQAESQGLDTHMQKIEANLDAGEAKTATARLAFLKWRFGEHGQAGTTASELMGRMLREQKD